jgi:hypothetical protein
LVSTVEVLEAIADEAATEEVSDAEPEAGVVERPHFVPAAVNVPP